MQLHAPRNLKEYYYQKMLSAALRESFKL